MRQRAQALIQYCRQAGLGVDWAMLERLRSRERVFIGVSGGADSVFLLNLMYALLDAKQVVVLHFDHATREGGSRSDALWVAEQCAKMGLECVQGLRRSEAAGTEAELRQARFDFFARSVADVSEPELLLAHHADDALETALMRLVRGSGSAGLAAPLESRRWCGGWLRRPLLKVAVAGIRAGLSEVGIRWREDYTNREPGAWRNRVREQVVPPLKQTAERDVLSGFSRSRQLLREDAAAIAWAVDDWEARHPDWVVAPEQLRGVAVGVVRQLFFRWWNALGQSDAVPAPVADEVVATLAEGGSNKSFRFAGKEIRLCREGLTVVDTEGERAPEYGFRIFAGQSVYFPSGWVLGLERVALSVGDFSKQVKVAVPSREAWLAGDLAAEGLVVRPLRAGDRYRPLGAPGTRKLHDCLVDRKIPQWERRLRPLVSTSTDSPVWFPGLPPADEWRVQKSAHWALRLTYGRV